MCSMFYPKNNFHLPPDPTNNTDGRYADLQHKHQKTIGTICIHLNLTNLTCGDMNMSAVDIPANACEAADPMTITAIPEA